LRKLVPGDGTGICESAFTEFRSTPGNIVVNDREFKSREVAETPIYVITHSLLKSHFTHNFSDP